MFCWALLSLRENPGMSQREVLRLRGVPSGAQLYGGGRQDERRVPRCGAGFARAPMLSDVTVLERCAWLLRKEKMGWKSSPLNQSEWAVHPSSGTIYFNN